MFNTHLAEEGVREFIESVAKGNPTIVDTIALESNEEDEVITFLQRSNRKSIFVWLKNDYNNLIELKR
jgi:hypothetical protein